MIALSKDLKRESAAGVTTFLTMAYIVVVNPAILSTQGTGMSFSAVMTATVSISLLMTLLMGVYAKLPFAVAPGMGLNAFFTFSLVLGKGIPWPTALGMVFWSGVFFVLLSVTPIRAAVAKAVPVELRIGAAAGIGIFLAFIGLKSAGFILADESTFVKFGGLSTEVCLATLGLLIIIYLKQKGSAFAFLGGIFLITVLGIALGKVGSPQAWVSFPNFEAFFALDILGSLKFAYLPAIITLVFTDLFDSLSTFMGVSHSTGMTDSQGQPKNMKEGLVVDALATLGSGLFGSSPATAYVESAAGIEAGGRTGTTSVVTALCFLPCFFVAPLAALVPSFATAPVLILVGAMMFRSVGQLSFERLDKLVPAYLTIILIPLTFSITQGVLWGILSYVSLGLISGKRRELNPVLIGLGVLSLGLLILES